MRDSDSFFSGSADDAVETLAAAAATAPEVTAGASGVASKAGMVTAASWVAPDASTLVATEAASELLEPFGVGVHQNPAQQYYDQHPTKQWHGGRLPCSNSLLSKISNSTIHQASPSNQSLRTTFPRPL